MVMIIVVVMIVLNGGGDVGDGCGGNDSGKWWCGNRGCAD